MIVVDASTVLDLLLRTRGVERIEARVLGARSSLHCPHLLDLEVAQVLRRYVSRGDMEATRARHVLDDLAALPMTRYPHQPFLRRIWELRANLTAYDASYVALAEVLPAPLVTRDARLRAAPGHGAVVEVL